MRQNAALVELVAEAALRRHTLDLLKMGGLFKVSMQATLNPVEDIGTGWIALGSALTERLVDRLTAS